MKKVLAIGLILGMCILSTAFLSDKGIQDLRSLYSKPISEWPKPTIDSGVKYEEFKSLTKIDTSYFSLMEPPMVKLGKLLFSDPNLSGSKKMSCSSCHNPPTSYGGHSTVPVGHDHIVGD